jgi:MoxR-like ATPase
MNTNRYSPDDLPPDQSERKYPYIPDKKLARIVNMAIALRRPLLVKGPPGCGKTRLAMSIAKELGLELYEWYIKSTSRARDGLYTIDMVRRLHDAQVKESKPTNLVPYIRFGPLGEAIRSGKESVVLIDEIDKADMDFPNDLLRELDEKKFTVEELDEKDLTAEDIANGFRKTYESEHPPIVIITSNDEKELSDAFLRRCLFYNISFPEKNELVRIVQVNTPDINVAQKLVESAVERLQEIRGVKGEEFRKAPATGELIDWVRILHYWEVKIEELDAGRKLAELPYWEILFKHQQDIKQAERASGKEGSR